LARTHLFIVDGGSVFVRAKTTDDPYSPYGRWRSLGGQGLERMTAAVAEDAALRLFANDGAGLLWTATTSDTSVAPIWGQFNADAAVADLDSGHTNVGRLSLYVTHDNGSVSSVEQAETGQWGAWQILKAEGVEPQLQALSVFARPGAEPFLIGVDTEGVVQRRDAGGDWYAIP
jgi:hypothetical protein